MSTPMRRKLSKAYDSIAHLDSNTDQLYRQVDSIIVKQVYLLDADRSADRTKTYKMTELRSMIYGLGLIRQNIEKLKVLLTEDSPGVTADYLQKRADLLRRVDFLEKRIALEFVPYAVAKRIIEQQPARKALEEASSTKGKNSSKNASERRRRKKKKQQQLEEATADE